LPIYFFQNFLIPGIVAKVVRMGLPSTIGNTTLKGGECPSTMLKAIGSYVALKAGLLQAIRHLFLD
jgi:hypothetical protein